MFVDSHAHLDSDDYASDLSAVIERAAQAGVRRILTVSCLGDARQADRVIDLVERHENLWAAVGVHPHDARVFDVGLAERIARMMEHPKVVAWGEIGLDFHYDYSPRESQREAFREQLRLAASLGKPVVIHTREAEEETCRILETVEALDGAPGVVHCFTSSRETALRCLNLGYCISFGGILTFPKAEDLRDTARLIPAERLLIETDSPYLAPEPYRGRRNEPAFVVKVAEVLAKTRGVSIGTIAEQTTENFNRLFKRRKQAARAGPL